MRTARAEAANSTAERPGTTRPAVPSRTRPPAHTGPADDFST